MLFGKNISKSFGAQTLFENADFQLNKGEKIAIIGRNGYGKSTLFRLILGQDGFDDGEIAYPEHYRIGSLDQHLSFNQKNIVEEVTAGQPEEKKYESWKAEKLLSGLGFKASDFTRKAEEFSGGFQIRIKLAQLLFSEPDLLLLDEPTNYLDITSLRWLENFLQSWKSEVMCVSHDQIFLEKICTHTIGVHRKKLRKIKGSPQKLFNHIAKEERIHEKTRKNDEKQRGKQEKFIREFRSGARSAGLVQSRIKMLAKKKKLNALDKIPEIKFKFTEEEFNGSKILEARNLSFGYKEGQDLLKKCSFEVFPGEKIGIIGANGKGKTTLLRALTKELKISSGVLKSNVKTRIGYFGQSNIDKLEGEKNIIETLQDAGAYNEQHARTIAASLLFGQNLAYKKINILSGGEKARVNLGRVLLHPTNFLLLDEPTNHLDYESVNALVESVKNFSGAAIFVSHNEYFLREIAQKLIVFDEEEVFLFEGTYDEFLEQKGFECEKEDASISPPPSGTPLKLRGDETDSLNIRQKKKISQRIARPLKKKIKELEKKIKTLEASQVENKKYFDLAYQQGNHLKMDTLGISYQEMQVEVEALWEEWAEVSEELEKLEN